jgi:VWFA-related protein
VQSRNRVLTALLINSALLSTLMLGLPPATRPKTLEKEKLQRPRQLDSGITWRRDPATGELHIIPKSGAVQSSADAAPVDAHTIQVVTQMVPVTCSVYTVDGAPVPGLNRADFIVFEDGLEQRISYFDASHQPASVALVIDASPSVLRDAEEMRRAADGLIDALAPLDQAAVVDFSAHTYLQASFSDVRELIRRAVARVDVNQLLGDTGGSNIYKAVYLTAKDLFPRRSGRKAIVLLTDGQDSGLGLTLDPASAMPSAGSPDRLTFDDVSRLLSAEDIQVFVVSTENRPRIMTPEWLASHANETLLTTTAPRSGIPAYTLYLAELVRRSGGQLYFLREAETLAGTFRQIARRIRAEYVLGYYPARGMAAPGNSRWHSLRVEVVKHSGVIVNHRATYYVPALP